MFTGNYFSSTTLVYIGKQWEENNRAVSIFIPTVLGRYSKLVDVPDLPEQFQRTQAKKT